MGRATAMCALLSLLAGGAFQARAETPTEARRAIQAQYDRMNRATMRKDIKTLATIYAPDAVLRQEDAGGTISAGKLLVQIKAMFPHVKMTAANTRIVAFRADGDTCKTTAVWSGESRFVAAAGDITAVDTTPRKVTQTVHDLWKKHGRTWQIAVRVIDTNGR